MIFYLGLLIGLPLALLIKLFYRNFLSEGEGEGALDFVGWCYFWGLITIVMIIILCCWFFII